LTDYLRYGEENVLVVRVDASMEEGWFYEGAGIYRHVWLYKLAPVHVARHGTWVRAQVDGSVANVSIGTTLVNKGRDDASTEIEQTILAPDGKRLAQLRSPPLAVAAGAEITRTDATQLRSPQLWSLEKPSMHTLLTVVRRAGVEIDRYETPFGIRTIRFDPNAGLFNSSLEGNSRRAIDIREGEKIDEKALKALIRAAVALNTAAGAARSRKKVKKG
jgi:beta-galactosidase